MKVHGAASTVAKATARGAHGRGSSTVSGTALAGTAESPRRLGSVTDLIDIDSEDEEEEEKVDIEGSDDSNGGGLDVGSADDEGTLGGGGDEEEEEAKAADSPVASPRVGPMEHEEGELQGQLVVQLVGGLVGQPAGGAAADRPRSSGGRGFVPGRVHIWRDGVELRPGTERRLRQGNMALEGPRTRACPTLRK